MVKLTSFVEFVVGVAFLAETAFSVTVPPRVLQVPKSEEKQSAIFEADGSVRPPVADENEAPSLTEEHQVSMRKFGKQDSEVKSHEDGKVQLKTSQVEEEGDTDEEGDTGHDEASFQGSCNRRRSWGSCSSSRRRWGGTWYLPTPSGGPPPTATQACDGKVLKIYGHDHAAMYKQVAWTLACMHVGSTVRFQGTWRDDTEGAYYVELADSSQVGALLSGTFTSRLSLIQGDAIDNWRNTAPGGMWITPSGHFEKTDGTDLNAQESAWLLFDNQENVIAPKWMKDAAWADQPRNCPAPAFDASCPACPNYKCVLVVDCIKERARLAPNSNRKTACNNILQGNAVTNSQRQCCKSLVASCRVNDPCAFDAVIDFNGHAFLEQQDDTVKPANDSRPGDQGASLDEAMTGKRSC